MTNNRLTNLERGNATFGDYRAAGLNEITRRDAMRQAWIDLDKGLKPECNVRHNARRGSAWELWYAQGIDLISTLTA